MVKTNTYRISKNQLILALIVSAFIGVSVSYGDFYLFHFILLSLASIWIYQIKEKNFLLNLNQFSKNHIPTLIAFFLWYVTSLFWAPSLELGFKYIFYIFCGLILTLSIVSYSSSINNLNKIFNLLSFFILIEIIIG